MSVLEMNNIRYSYDNKRNVLNGINMALDEGKISDTCGRADWKYDLAKQAETIFRLKKGKVIQA